MQKTNAENIFTIVILAVEWLIIILSNTKRVPGINVLRTLYRCIYHTINELILQDWKKCEEMRILILLCILEQAGP